MTDPSVKPKEEGSSTSTTLIRRVKRGDQTAWQRLIRFYGPRVERRARMAGLQAADVADVLQDVFLAVSKNIVRFRRDRPGDKFRCWLNRIVGNKLNDHWRSKQKLPDDQSIAISAWNEPVTHSISGSSVDADRADPILAQYVRVIEQVRNQVDERDWQMFEMVVAQQLSPAEVAKQFEVSRNVVYLTKSRLLKRCRERFEQQRHSSE